MIQQWRNDANCMGKSTTIFFPEFLPLGERRWDDARAICDGCLVQQECLDMAIVYEDAWDRWGYFGNKTPAERADIRFELKIFIRKTSKDGQNFYER